MAKRSDIGATRLTGGGQRREAAAERLADDSARRARLAGDVATSSTRTIGQASAHSFGAARVPQSHVQGHVAAPKPRSVANPAATAAGAKGRPTQPPALGRSAAATPAPARAEAAPPRYAPAMRQPLPGKSTPTKTGPVAVPVSGGPRPAAPEGSTLATSSARAAEAGSRMSTSADRRAALAARSSTWSSRRIGEAEARSFSVGGQTPWVGPTGKGRKGPRAVGGLAARAAAEVKSSTTGDKQAGGVAILAAAAENKLLHRGGYRAALSVAAAAGGKDSAAGQAEHAWQTASSAKRKVKRAVKTGKSVAHGTRFVATHAVKGDLVSATKKAAAGGIQKRYQKLRYAFSLSRRINKLKATAQVIRGHGLGTWAKSVASAFAKQTLGKIKVAIVKLAVPLLIGILVVIGGGAIAGVMLPFAAGTQTVEGLTDNEQAVYSFFSEKGLSNNQIAGILANMWGESRVDPTAVEVYKGEAARDWTDDELYILSRYTARGVGLCQWSYERRVSLLRWAKSEGRDWKDVSTQLEFFWEHDEWGGDWHGGSGDTYGSKDAFLSADSPEEACRQFYFGFERGSSSAISDREEKAREYYTLFTSSGGKGHEYQLATEQQKAIVDACYAEPTAGAGWCASWVTYALARSGVASAHGDADDMYDNYTWSTNRDDLKPGMIVAVKPTVTDACGHVGIYVGDGLVAHCSGSAPSGSTEISYQVWLSDIDAWNSYYNKGIYPMRWGFPAGL